MIEKPIPKDIREYEARQVGPFTWRQLICVVIAVGIGIPARFILKNYLPSDVCSILTVLLVAAPLAFCIKPYGMTFEKFAAVYIRNFFLAPNVRMYKVSNPFGQAVPDITATEDGKKRKREKVTEKDFEPIL